MRVLDQRGDLSEIPLPTGRAAFMERLNAVLGDQDDDGQRQCTKILLVLEVLIGGQEYIEVVGGDT